MKFADPKSNIAFKKIFGNENKKEILISFINAALDLEGDQAIKDVDILDPYQAPKLEMLKETVLDVRVKDHRGFSFIVEMQVERQEHFAKRALYYTSKAYVSQIDKAVDYAKLSPVIFIGILNFSIFKSEHYLSRHLLLNIENNQNEIKDIAFTFIELTKFKLEEDKLETIIDKWVFFIKHAENLEVIPEKLKGTRAIVEAFEMANRHNWTKSELELYEYWELQEGSRLDALQTAKNDGKREGREEGKREGREEGRKEGREEGKEEVVLRMNEKGLAIKEIFDLTGLSEEKVKLIIASENS
ncbi:MAG: Rpn family recombination-promoting nuclease/putative transposase [Methanosarcinaceae archaeon]